ncbi:UDP-glucose dehydrogenase family protein [Parafrankia discariae]|uniref:UDP-glucose dehydrogenase family protein n=1 Tax=Parafrankia discariae TaxID=365528 RepID=UPI0003A89F7A|nr:UDP-glucose/GDP-mannose dehydrogenase family protein [Parafrankia discariae]
MAGDPRSPGPPTTGGPPAVRRIGVVGTGYLGATHAVCMAELGYEVMGLDTDADKVRRLGAGEVPFFEPGLEELLRKHLEAGRLSFTGDPAEVAGWADVHFICVGTPQRAGDGAADMTYVDAAVETLIRAGLRPDALVVGKSTVPAGSAERLARRLAAGTGGTGPGEARAGEADAGEAAAGGGAELAWNPEFLREGFAVDDTLRPDRLVFGVRPGGRGEAVLRAVYAATIEAGTPVIVTDYATAELVKVAANAFLATKISFINAMSEVCDAAGGDVTSLARALSHDARIGGRFLRPGIGFGGGCLPKDIRAFHARAAEIGAGPALGFLTEVDRINLRARQRTVSLITRTLGGQVAGRRITVLGAAFKPNSDDIRDSPALEISAELHRAGARVVVYDPAAMANARRRFPELEYAPSAHEAATGADALAVLTEWTEFRDLDPDALTPRVAGRVVVDGRHALDGPTWRRAGWAYHALGRPPA